MDGVFERLHLLQPRSKRLFPRNEVVSPQLIYHLFSALSVHGKTKAPLLSLNTYIFHTVISFLKIINEESAQFDLPFTSVVAIACEGEYELWMRQWVNVIWISKSSAWGKLAGRLERFSLFALPKFCVCF